MWVIDKTFWPNVVTNALPQAILVGKVGYHTTSIDLSQLLALNEVKLSIFPNQFWSNRFQTIIAAEVLRNSANSCVKLSLLHLYLTIFPMQRFRYVVFAVMMLVMCYWAISLLRMVFLCHPMAYEWNKSIRGGTCLNTAAAYYSISGINLGLDLVVIMLPMPVLWTLQMPIPKKVAISMIFGMGVM